MNIHTVVTEMNDDPSFASPDRPGKWLLDTHTVFVNPVRLKDFKLPPIKGGTVRTCERCSGSMEGRRKDARFCTDVCRALASRDARRLERDKEAAKGLGLSLTKYRAARGR